MSARDRLTSDGFDLFPPTADGILAWLKTTQPAPARQDVIAHARSLARDGLLSAVEVELLAAAGYSELAAAPEDDPVERAMREVREERPDLVEAPVGQRDLGDLDENLDAAYWQAVEERAALIRADGR